MNNGVVGYPAVRKVGPVAATVAVNAQTGTAYTLGADDAGKVVECSNAAAVTVTIPQGVLPPEAVVSIRQSGAGQVTVSAGANVTLRNPFATAKTRATWSELSIHQRATNDFVLAGDAAAT